MIILLFLNACVRPLLKPVFLICFTFLCSACSINKVNILPTLSPGQAPSKKGLVIARVIDATNVGLPINQLTIIPQNLNESKKIKPSRLIALQSRMNGTTVFASPVDPGNYSLASISAFHSRGTIQHGYFAHIDSQFGLFQVKAGQVTDLGAIVYYRKPQGDRYVDTVLRVDDAHGGEVLKENYPSYKGDLSEILTWKEDGLSDQRQAQLASVAQNPTTFNNRYLAPDGSVYFLAKLGVIIYLQPDAGWGMDAVDTNLDLNAIAVSRNGRIAVGGSEGVIFYKPRGGEWTDVSLDADYDVEALRFSPNGDLDVVARTRFKLSVFRTELDLSSGEWRELNSFVSETGWKHRNVQGDNHGRPWGRRISSVELMEIDGANHITVFYHHWKQNPVFAHINSEIFVYDPETWEMRVPATSPTIMRIRDAGAVKVGIETIRLANGRWRNSYYRYDSDNAKWEKIVTAERICAYILASDGEPTCIITNGARPKLRHFSFVSLPWFKNNREALAAVRFLDTYSPSGIAKGDVQIVKTKNGGKSWYITNLKLPREQCISIVTEVIDRLIISCNGASGDFFASNDGGETWEHTRQHEDF